jgi:hypothetical protein
LSLFVLATASRRQEMGADRERKSWRS